MSELHELLTRAEIQRLLGISEEFLRILEREAILPGDREGRHPRSDLERIRVCWTLHEELGVNPAGLEVALHLLERIERERRQFQQVLSWLQQQMGDV